MSFKSFKRNGDFDMFANVKAANDEKAKKSNLGLVCLWFSSARRWPSQDFFRSDSRLAALKNG